MTKFAIGVDLGGTNLRVALVDDAGKVLEKNTLGTEVAKGRDYVIDEMCLAVRDIVAKHKSSGSLAGIGIGVPGIIDMESGTLRHSPNLPGWDDYPVRNEIERRLGAPVILENDANVAALGEKWLGAAKAADDMCMITLGTGIGGGIVLHGKIWHGMSGMAAELGHVTVEPDGAPCGCGSHGCVEQYASASAIQRMASEAISSGAAPRLAKAAAENGSLSAKAVYDMALAGDETAQKILWRAGRALGILIADLVNIFNLPMYVIGGGVAAAWDAFAPAMFEEVRLRSYIYKATAPQVEGKSEATAKRSTLIIQASLGGDAGLIGAARIALMR